MTNPSQHSVEERLEEAKKFMRWDEVRYGEPTLLEYLRYYKGEDIGEIHIEAAIEAEKRAYAAEQSKQYDDIFNWLLGANGDFPMSEPGKRYNWRTELRERLAELRSKAGLEEK